MTLLVLGGSGEGRQLSQRLVQLGFDHIVSLAGATRAPILPEAKVRIGGFGSAQGFADYLREQSIHAVVDATHPFASNISARSAQVANKLGLPYVQVLRPPWQPQPGDRWTMIDDEGEAAHHVAPGQVVFLATGRQTLMRYANCSHATLICRQIDPPDEPFPFPNGRFEIGRPPFSVAEEKALFTQLGVDWLVTKNSGGDAPRSKLDAARDMGLPVLMINRPPKLDVPTVETVDAAVAWVRAL